MRWICLNFCDVFSVQKQKSEADKARLCQELSCLVQDAHTALTDLRSANAEQAFRRALSLMETTTPKVTKPSREADSKFLSFMSVNGH